jgi:hypothetical protein
MPATTRYALPYPASTDPADVPADMQALAVKVEAVIGMPAIAAAPPASPVDGQLWAFQPVAGTIWLFRYNAASGSPYKWEFVGGAPLKALVLAGLQNNANNVFQHPAGAPTLTLARAGDYLCEWAGNVTLTNPGTVQITGAIGASPFEPIAFVTTPAAGLLVTIGTGGLAAGVTAGATLNWVTQVSSGGFGSMIVDHATLSALPVRVA